MGKYASRQIDADLLGGYPPSHYSTSTEAPAKTVVSFAATATPTLSNYQATYATTYGEHPSVQLVTIDGDGNYIERNERPKYNISAGLINSISWDLPDIETGFIIIRI